MLTLIVMVKVIFILWIISKYYYIQHYLKFTLCPCIVFLFFDRVHRKITGQKKSTVSKVYPFCLTVEHCTYWAAWSILNYPALNVWFWLRQWHIRRQCIICEEGNKLPLTSEKTGHERVKLRKIIAKFWQTDNNWEEKNWRILCAWKQVLNSQ